VIEMEGQWRVDRPDERKKRSKWRATGDVAIWAVKLAAAAVTLYVALKGSGLGHW
jgi:hypothetical protein